VKKLTSTVNRGSRSRSPKKTTHIEDFKMELENLKANIVKSNKQIEDLKHDIEMNKKISHGQVPTEDLIQMLRHKELQVA
jgi:hypothetical protein